MQLPRPTSGQVVFDGARHDASCSGDELRQTRTRMQMIFQDPISSLNPRRKVEDIIAEGLRIWKVGTDEEQQAKVDEMMLDASASTPTLPRGRRPHQFSGGQCQRISIARAVVTDPKLIICDEPVSALDVSVQAQILNLLEDMKARYGLTLIFIAHDLAVVKNVSDRVVGDVPRQDLRGRPSPTRSTRSPRTRTPRRCSTRSPCPTRACGPRRGHASIGEIPSPVAPPSGCRFRTRCPQAQEQVRARRSRRSARSRPGQFVACHFPLVEAGEVPTEPSTADVAIAGASSF